MHENPPSTIGAQSLGWPSSCLASSESPRLQNNVFSPRGVGPALRASQSLPWRGHPAGDAASWRIIGCTQMRALAALFHPELGTDSICLAASACGKPVQEGSVVLWSHSCTSM